jgi:hypothetical protein
VTTIPRKRGRPGLRGSQESSDHSARNHRGASFPTVPGPPARLRYRRARRRLAEEPRRIEDAVHLAQADAGQGESSSALTDKGGGVRNRRVRPSAHAAAPRIPSAECRQSSPPVHHKPMGVLDHRTHHWRCDRGWGRGGVKWREGGDRGGSEFDAKPLGLTVSLADSVADSVFNLNSRPWSHPGKRRPVRSRRCRRKVEYQGRQLDAERR